MPIKDGAQIRNRRIQRKGRQISRWTKRVVVHWRYDDITEAELKRLVKDFAVNHKCSCGMCKGHKAKPKKKHERHKHGTNQDL